MNHEYDRHHQVSREPSRPTDEGSAARRLFWVVVGATAFVAAKFAFGF